MAGKCVVKIADQLWQYSQRGNWGVVAGKRAEDKYLSKIRAIQRPSDLNPAPPIYGPA